jgi:photosystem II stability/assembly factor-like uncharacterized protein
MSLAAFLPGLFAEAAAQIVCPDETIYVAMLGTRKHRLSGENPTVGVFYTVDAGETWQHTGWAQGKAFSVYVPENSCGDTLWIAAGNGVMRSTDGGDSWRITTGWEVTEVQDVVADPTGSGHIVAATPYGIYTSPDMGETWSSSRPGFASSVRFDRTDSALLVFASERGLVVGEDTVVTRPVRSVRQSPHDPHVWAAALQNGGVVVRKTENGTWESSDLESTIYEVEFHPENDQTLYAGGWNTGLLVSNDLGATWDRVQTLHVENIHGIAISRRNPDVIIVGSMDDGVFVTRDAGRNWVRAAPELFDEGQVWDVHIRGE